MPAILYPVSKTVKIIKAIGFSGRTGIPIATDDDKGLAIASSKKNGAANCAISIGALRSFKASRR